MKKNLAGKKVILCEVKGAEYKADYCLKLKFSDGSTGVADLTKLIKKGIFKKLANVKSFVQFSLEYGTVIWPGDLDLAPKYLYKLATGRDWVQT